MLAVLREVRARASPRPGRGRGADRRRPAARRRARRASRRRPRRRARARRRSCSSRRGPRRPPCSWSARRSSGTGSRARSGPRRAGAGSRSAGRSAARPRRGAEVSDGAAGEGLGCWATRPLLGDGEAPGDPAASPTEIATVTASNARTVTRGRRFTGGNDASGIAQRRRAAGAAPASEASDCVRRGRARLARRRRAPQASALQVRERGAQSATHPASSRRDSRHRRHGQRTPRPGGRTGRR